MSQVRGGIYRISVDGQAQDCVGEATYNLGVPKATPIMGSDGRVKGVTLEGQEPFIEVDVLDRPDLDLATFLAAKDVTVAINLANGKTVVLSHAVQSGEGTVTTKDGVVKVKWIGAEAIEVPAV